MSPISPAPALSANIVSHTSLAPTMGHAGTNEDNGPVKKESDREVIRCAACGMVQYRTRSGNCRETVEKIGKRIRQLRESCGMTRSQLQALSRVTQSYLSRIESGQMTPSLDTLEKISEALGIGMNRFFLPESMGEALLENPFVQGLLPFLRQLDLEQWQSILKRLAVTPALTPPRWQAAVKMSCGSGVRLRPIKTASRRRRLARGAS